MSLSCPFTTYYKFKDKGDIHLFDLIISPPFNYDVIEASVSVVAESREPHHLRSVLNRA